jgi:hypothetical protein
MRHAVNAMMEIQSELRAHDRQRLMDDAGAAVPVEDSHTLFEDSTLLMAMWWTPTYDRAT